MSSFDAGDAPDLNPYAAPRALGRAPARYFRVAYWRLTYGEHWRTAPNVLAFVLMALFKTLRINIAAQLAPPYPDRLDLIDFDELPPHARERMRPALGACADLGSRIKLARRVGVIGSGERYQVVLVRNDGRWTVAVTYSRALFRARERTVVQVDVVSRLQDGRRAATTDNPRALFSLPDTIIQSAQGLSLAEMVARHFDWIAASGWTPVRSPEEMLEHTILSREQALFDQYVERGIYLPITEREYAKLARSTPSALPPPSRARRVVSTVEHTLWGLVIIVGLYVLFGGPDQRFGPKAEFPPLFLVFFGMAVAAWILGFIRRLLTPSK
jgi:hypothetical protein